MNQKIEKMRQLPISITDKQYACLRKDACDIAIKTGNRITMTHIIRELIDKKYGL